MRSTSFGTVALAALLSAACSAAPEASLDTEDQQASYAIGLNLASQSQLAATQGLLDMPAFMKGVEDAVNEADPALDPEVLQAALEGFSTRVQEAMAARMEEEGAANREAGAAYLAENAARDEVTTTESGLQYEVLQPGDGPTPEADDQVRIHYRGTLIDGTEFDSSYERGEPSQFGVGGVIPGFAEGLQLMEVGSSYRFVIPSDIAYGPQGSGGAIGPDATLIFEVELLEIVEE